MRVALIGPVPPHLGGATPGGVATHQVHLAAGLNAAGVDAPLLATNSSGPAGCAPFQIDHVPARWAWRDHRSAGALGRLSRYGLSLWRTAAPLGSRREVLRHLLAYRRFLSEVQPDVIHVQHPLERASYTHLVQTLEGWHQPLVITAHSLFGEHESATIETLMAPNLRQADRVIAVSDHIAEQAVQLGVDRARVRVIRSGVDTQQFRPRDRAAARRALGLANSRSMVLFVGNLEPRKQLDVLLRAIVAVREHVPDVVLVVVGSGESAGVQDQTARLARLAQDLGLGPRARLPASAKMSPSTGAGGAGAGGAGADGAGADGAGAGGAGGAAAGGEKARLSSAETSGGGLTVRFVGRVADDVLHDYYAAADVFVLPSSSEAQGIVALEAMACGLAVIASAVGGLVGTIDDGRTGYLVPSGDVEALAQQLTRVLHDAPQRQRVGLAARASVEQRFSWQRAVEATLDVYRELVTSR